MATQSYEQLISGANKIRKNDLSRFTVLYRPAFFVRIKELEMEKQ